MSRTAPGQTGLCDADLVGRQEQEFQNNSAAEAWVQEVSSSVFRSLMPHPRPGIPSSLPVYLNGRSTLLANLRHSPPLLLVSTLGLPYPAHSLTLLLVCNGWNGASGSRQPVFPNPEKL